MTRFLLIRHATNDAVGKRFAGRVAGLHLNEEGQAQAKKLAERLAHISIAAIYSSPMERTVETAAPTAKQHNLQVTTMGDFIELDLGEWTNKTIAELEKVLTFQHFNSYRSGTRVPGGELMLETQSRMVIGLQKLCAKHPEQTVAVVSHADPIKAVIAYYAGIPLDLFHRIEISPASVSVVELYEETPRIILVNDTGELKF